MPSIKRKICNKHGIYTGTRCPECKATRDKMYDKTSRNTESAKFYNSTRWRKVRQEVMMRDNGLCVKCGDTANVVDHIIEIKDGGCKLCYENLESLCHLCHNRKTAGVKRNREGRD